MMLELHWERFPFLHLALLLCLPILARLYVAAFTVSERNLVSARSGQQTPGGPKVTLNLFGADGDRRVSNS